VKKVSTKIERESDLRVLESSSRPVNIVAIKIEKRSADQ
jgi:hypothetical protein